MAHVFVDLHLGDRTATGARQGPGATLVSWIVRAQDTGGVRGMACACAAVATREPTVLKESVRQGRSRKQKVFRQFRVYLVPRGNSRQSTAQLPARCARLANTENTTNRGQGVVTAWQANTRQHKVRPCLCPLLITCHFWLYPGM